ncbi:MAG: flagellar biosynthetic protein FliQ [Candidatus Cloacimonadota bacterium]|nr:MAG: flagellar biosynthetic protein FliQ [Candidatus Cloacimonadota bacterium]PIE79343.1 MAG: flagellar biosynthetic protein FliQ [Candidatus Delongbacteria bacterium]
MDQEFVLYILTRSVNTAVLLSAPILLVGLIVGLVIGIFQSATQIQEMTLTFIPKMIAVLATLIIGLPWMMNLVLSFTQEMFNLIVLVSQ